MNETTAYSQALDMLQQLPFFLRKHREERGKSALTLSAELGLGKNTILRFEQHGIANERVLLILLNWMHEEELRDRGITVTGGRPVANPYEEEPSRVGVLSRKTLGGVVTW